MPWCRSACLSIPMLAFLAGPAGAASFLVSTTADTGEGSLRQAVADANASPGVDGITFAIPAGSCSAAGVCSIALASSLPDVSEGVEIDGTTQPRYGTAPDNVCAGREAPSYMRVEVTGPLEGLTPVFNVTAAEPVSIRGLALGGGAPIRLRSSGTHRVQCNHVGLDGPGTGSLALGFAGVIIETNGRFAIIGSDGDGGDDLGERNAFSPASSYGVYVNGNHDNRIAGNLFGLAGDGITPRPCATAVLVRQGSSTNLVGSDEDGLSDDLEANRFEGCTTGVLVQDPSNGTGNQVVRNRFGAVAANGVAIDLRGSTDTVVRNNVIAGGTTGLRVYLDATLSPLSQGNCLAGNATGLLHEGSAALVLERNWWGAADGPGGDGPGTGDPIEVTGTGSLDVEPFETAGCVFVPEPGTALAGLACGGTLAALGLRARRPPPTANGGAGATGGSSR